MINWVHDELLAWGEWAARCDDGKGDYPSHCAFAAPPSGAENRRDAPFERVPSDYEAVDKAVKLLHPDRLKLTVMHLYKNGYRIRRTAAAMLVDHKTVINYRDQAHVTVGRLLTPDPIDKRSEVPHYCGEYVSL